MDFQGDLPSVVPHAPDCQAGTQGTGGRHPPEEDRGIGDTQAEDGGD